MNNEIPLLTIVVNTKGDNTIEGFIVVEKHTDEYDENLFGSFVSLPKNLEGELLLNQFDNILDNMIQPLINHLNEIIDKDIEYLVLKYRIEKPIEPKLKTKSWMSLKLYPSTMNIK